MSDTPTSTSIPAANDNMPDALHERIEACHEQYQLHFIGQPRLTRNVAILDGLIATLTPLLEQLPVTEHARRKEVNERLTDYRAERHAIATAQDRAGPQGCSAAHLKLRVSFVMHRYMRHFAGQPRSSRDLGLLREIVTDLKNLLVPVTHLTQQKSHVDHDRAAMIKVLAALEQSQSQLSQEAEAIRATRLQHEPNRDQKPTEAQARSQALLLAQAANNIFASYQELVIGRIRLSVRPELIARLARELASLHEAMQALADAGWGDAGHLENCSIMAAHHRSWLEEHQETVNLRRQHTMDEIAQALNEEAETVLQAYNQTIATQQMTPDRRRMLSILCDRMDELHRQIESVPQIPGHKHHDTNAAMITDALTMLMNTYDASRDPSST